MGYWSYYLLWMVAMWLFQYPPLLLGVVAFFLLRRFIPDPWVWLRTASKIRALRSQIDANPSNTTARRDLARIYLERMRPRTALKLLDEARQRHPDDPELLFLTGLARVRARRYEEALPALVEAIEADPRTGFGEPFKVAGDALWKLNRLEECEDAYERYTDANSSSLEGWYKLARVRRERGEKPEAKRAMDELFRTWRQIPGYSRRKQWRWWLRALPARLGV
ncbi:MAG: hypothetical protein CMN30_31105 [Sandaracinus sp.]|nr:hypothetical protein [Sandaracinus sp.]|tara:strand:+ start:5996 stop:6664 length:669 start_codon:yes stop_codon:yes gene_type:complete